MNIDLQVYQINLKNIHYEIIHDDLEAFYSSRLTNDIESFIFNSELNKVPLPDNV